VRPKRQRDEEKKSAPRGAKRARTNDDEGAAPAVEGASAPVAAPAAVPAHVLPSRTLLVQGLPTNLTSETLDSLLKKLFGQFACVVGAGLEGFRECCRIRKVSPLPPPPPLS
jgi:hypothetical protein